MATVTAYWRPTSIAEVVDLLDRPDAVLIGGGTTLKESTGPRVDEVAVIDLQALGLAGIHPRDRDRLSIGATTTLQEIADDPGVPLVLRDAAKRELPSTLRHQATIGGCVASADWESELLAALLAYEAVASLEGAAGVEEVPLEELFAHRDRLSGRLITEIAVSTGGTSAADRTARTPADRPIVAAVARLADGMVRVAVSGVAQTPVLVAGDPALDPPGDFRGSPEYRAALAEVLIARVTEALS